MAALIEVKRLKTDGRSITTFVAVFDIPPADEDVVNAQRIAGYAPEGYGLPWNIQSPDDCDGSIVFWSCQGSCD